MHAVAVTLTTKQYNGFSATRLCVCSISPIVRVAHSHSWAVLNPCNGSTAALNGGN